VAVGASGGGGAQQVHAAVKVVTEVHHTDLIFVANAPDASVIDAAQRHLHEGEDMFDPRPSF